MLSYIDPILFPDECNIYKIGSDNFYPIFKNGSSSIKSAGTLVTNIEDLESVHVFVRDPYQRYVSGVQTYLQHNPKLDRNSTLEILSNVLFLNRHFSLQFHWLVNLARFANCKIHLRPINELSLVTAVKLNESTRESYLTEYFSSNNKLHYYLTLDKILCYDLVGQTLSWSQILRHTKDRYPELYKEVILRSKNICNVLV